jgi:hypothetical protein
MEERHGSRGETINLPGPLLLSLFFCVLAYEMVQLLHCKVLLLKREEAEVITFVQADGDVTVSPTPETNTCGVLSEDVRP